MDYREIGSGVGRWLELAVDCVQWQALVWAVLSLWVLLPDSWMDLMEIGSEDWGAGDKTGVESCPLRALALVVLNLHFLLP